MLTITSREEGDHSKALILWASLIIFAASPLLALFVLCLSLLLVLNHHHRSSPHSSKHDSHHHHHHHHRDHKRYSHGDEKIKKVAFPEETSRHATPPKAEPARSPPPAPVPTPGAPSLVPPPAFAPVVSISGPPGTILRMSEVLISSVFFETPTGYLRVQPDRDLHMDAVAHRNVSSLIGQASL